MATAEEADRSPRLVKVIRLEFYEDAFNNLTFDEKAATRQSNSFKTTCSPTHSNGKRDSETLLNLKELQSPFSYKL